MNMFTSYIINDSSHILFSKALSFSEAQAIRISGQLYTKSEPLSFSFVLSNIWTSALLFSNFLDMCMGKIYHIVTGLTSGILDLRKNQITELYEDVYLPLLEDNVVLRLHGKLVLLFDTGFPLSNFLYFFYEFLISPLSLKLT